MTKKTPRQLLEKKLDDLVSLIVRRRDGRCITCNATEGLTCSHYISRSKRRLRWDLRNVNSQCFACNGAHRYWPHIYAGYMRRRYGNAVLDELEKLADIPAWRWELYELEDMLEALRNLYSEMTGKALNYEEEVIGHPILAVSNN